MNVLLNIVAIFAGVALFMRYAVRPYSPRFSIKKRLTEKAVSDNMFILGRMSANVARGTGLDLRAANLRKASKIVEKRIKNGEHGEWCRAVYNDLDRLERAYDRCKKTVRTSYALGHVGRAPRLFVFCEALVRYSCGNIDSKIYSLALKQFEKNAPLDGKELAAMPGMLEYCLIGLLCTAIIAADAHDRVYYRGAEDGKSDMADLDYITDADYVCGLYSSFADRAALDRLLDCNGIDKVGLLRERRALVAERYAIIVSCLDSIDRVLGTFREHVEMQSEKSSVAVKICNIAIIGSTALYATLTCVFVSPEFCALFAVLSAITYGLLRLPALVGSGGERAIDVFGRFDKLMADMSERRRSKRVAPTPSRASELFETAYIDEIDATDFVISGESAEIRLSNGDVRLLLGGEGVKLDAFARCGENIVELSNARLLRTRGACVYAMSIGNTELFIELYALADCAASRLDISAINRGESEARLDICVAIASEKASVSQSFSGGAECIGGGITALSFDCCAEYGNNYRAVKSGGAAAFSEKRIAPALGVAKLSVPPFSKRTVRACVVHAPSDAEISGAVEYALDGSGGAFYRECASAYNRPYAAPRELPFSAPSGEKEEPTVYPSVPLAEAEREIQLSDGGYLSAGAVVSDVSTDGVSGHDNLVSDGKTGAVFNDCGVAHVFLRGREYTRADGICSDSPTAFITLAERSVAWSPTYEPSGKGEMRVEHRMGYSRYICSYNGTVSAFTAFSAHGVGLVFFLSLENTEDIRRELDITLSLSLARSAVYRRVDNSVVLRGGRTVMRISSSEEIVSCECKKGPVVSIKKKLAPKGKAAVYFCLSAGSRYDISDGAMLCKECATRFARLSKVALFSDDPSLDAAHGFSLYRAYMMWLHALSGGAKLGARELFFYAGAVKYADLKNVRAAIVDEIARFALSPPSDPDDCLFAVSAVIEYVRFADEKKLFKTPVRAKKREGDRGEYYISVAEACMRLIDRAVSRTRYSAMPAEAYKDGLLIDALHYFSGVAGSMRALTYSRALRDAAGRFSRELSYIKNAEETDLSDCVGALIYARLLYLCDEPKRAYGVLKYYKDGRGIVFNGDASDVEYGCCCALFYSTVIEYMLGAAVRGKIVDISPRVFSGAPHLEFDIRGERDVHIVVDDSEREGSWITRVGRVSYSTARINTESCAERITMRRNGGSR